MTRRTGAHTAGAALLALAGLSSAASHAETLLVIPGQVVQGQLALAQPFTVPGAGTVSVTLTDLNWPAALASLTFAATTPTAVVASLSGAGQTSFTVGSTGLYDAVVDAVASPQALLNLGEFSLTVNFTAAVPLPPTSLLMLSGFGCLALFLLGKSRGETPNPGRMQPAS